MSSTGQRSTSGALPPRGGLPRWAWAIMVLLLVVAVAAVAVAVTAVRGEDSTPTASPTPTSTTAVTSSPAPTGTTSSSTSPAQTLAEGCVGGRIELDQAVVTAQHDSALTRVGAASFAATLARWAFAGPPPPFQQRTAKKIMAPHATAAAKHWLSSSRDLKGSTGTLDFSTGTYYIEAFEGTTAVVSYLGTGHVADNGVAQPTVLLAGAVHLQAVNGVWRLQDKSNERSIADMQRIGVPYIGGC